MSYRHPLGQTPATPAPPSTESGSPLANALLIGGPVAGVIALIVGHAMGQHRLWTEHIFPGKRGGHR